MQREWEERNDAVKLLRGVFRELIIVAASGHR
jgi:hypothetical protein